MSASVVKTEYLRSYGSSDAVTGNAKYAKEFRLWLSEPVADGSACIICADALRALVPKGTPIASGPLITAATYEVREEFPGRDRRRYIGTVWYMTPQLQQQQAGGGGGGGGGGDPTKLPWEQCGVWRRRPDPYVWMPGAEDLDGKKFQLPNGDILDPLPELKIYGARYTYTFNTLDKKSECASWTVLEGKSNSNNCYIGPFLQLAAPGTLLFLGVEASDAWYGETHYFQCTMDFCFKPTGWIKYKAPLISYNEIKDGSKTRARDSKGNPTSTPVFLNEDGTRRADASGPLIGEWRVADAVTFPYIPHLEPEEQ
jgi:hypothetical protein